MCGHGGGLFLRQPAEQIGAVLEGVGIEALLPRSALRVRRRFIRFQCLSLAAEMRARGLQVSGNSMAMSPKASASFIIAESSSLQSSSNDLTNGSMPKDSAFSVRSRSRWMAAPASSHAMKASSLEISPLGYFKITHIIPPARGFTHKSGLPYLLISRRERPRTNGRNLVHC